jgi:hypothetical protein
MEGDVMFKKWIEKYIGSTRLFFSLLAFMLTISIAFVSFFFMVELSSQEVSLLLGALSSAMAYVAVETIRKS